MSRMQPISPITPDVAQMVQAGGQQANVRNQQAIQQAQIAQRGQIAQQQQQVQREQMQNQQQIAQGNRAVQLAGVYEQARSQSEYRDFLREKASVEQDLARQRMSVDAQQHQEEMALRKSVADRSYGLELSGYQARLAGLKADEVSAQQFEDEMAAINAEADRLSSKMHFANRSVTEGGLDVDREKAFAVQGLDKTIASHTDAVDRQNQSIGVAFLDANAFANDATIVGRAPELGITGFLEKSGRVLEGTLTPNITEGFDYDYGVMQALEYMGETTNRVNIPGITETPEAIETPKQVLDRKTADAVANSLGGITESQKGQVRELMGGLLARLPQISNHEDRLALRAKAQEEFNRIGVSDTLLIDEALNSAAKIIRGNVNAYSALALGDDITTLDSYEAELPVNFIASDGTVSRTENVRADLAFLNSRIYTPENAESIFQLAAMGSSLDRLRSFRDILAEGELTTESLLDTINENPFGESLRGGDLFTALTSLDAAEGDLESLTRASQDFGIEERRRATAANMARQRGGRGAEIAALEAMMRGLAP